MLREVVHLPHYLSTLEEVKAIFPQIISYFPFLFHSSIIYLRVVLMPIMQLIPQPFPH